MLECLLKFLLSCGAVLLLGVQRLVRAGLQRWLRRLLGLGVVTAFVMLLAPIWHPVFGLTALIQVDVAARDRVLPVLREQPIAYLYGGYDGQYYAQLACDPSLRMPGFPRAVDSLAYRARRILLPATAWAAAGGDPVRAFRLYPWINVLCWFALAAVLWRMLAADDSWAGLVAWGGVMFSAGVLASVRFSLTDMPSLLLFVLAMRAADRGRPGAMCGWFAASLLARETMLIGAWGLLRARAGVMRGWLRAGLWVALALIPLLGWLLYVRAQASVGEGVPGGGSRNFAWPAVGLVHRWQELAAMVADPGKDRWIVWVSVLGMVSVCAQIGFVIVRPRWENVWWRVGAGFAVLALLLGDAVWEGFPGAGLRVLLPLLFACNLLALELPSRWRWLGLILFNLSAVLMLREFNPARSDVAAARSGYGTVVLNQGAGCYGPERSRSECWVWTQSDAAWRVEARGDPAEYILTGRVRSLDERGVALLWQGRVIWRGKANQDWTSFRSEPFRIEAGDSSLHIMADRPGVTEGPNPDARSLSTCFLNVGLVEAGRE